MGVWDRIGELGTAFRKEETGPSNKERGELAKA
jgi:hypothetical protein